MRHLALFALVAVATAACGGGSDASTTTGSDAPVTSVASSTTSSPVPTDVSTTRSESTSTVPAATGFYQWDGQTWTANGDVPPCPDDLTGFFAVAPVDVSKATAVLAPGQSRGGNYKPHGGFRFDGTPNDDVVVVLYLLQFRTPCGIMFRFDHLRVLAPAVQAAIEEVPEAADGSSRTTVLRTPFEMRAGDAVATSVGFVTTGNTSMDFGVYDPRQQNEASLDSAFPEQQFRELAWYGVCWYTMLPPAAAAVVDTLPGGDATAGRSSDYCSA
jgi:hypothetical protein